MNILELEEIILKELIDELINQVGDDVPCRNILQNVRPRDLIHSIDKGNLVITNSQRYGIQDEDYTWNLVLVWDEDVYQCSIKYSYSGGSCTGCDAVMYAENKDDDSYMKNQIKDLKFFTFSKITPK